MQSSREAGSEATGGHESPDLAAAGGAVTAAMSAVTNGTQIGATAVLDALVQLHWIQAELTAIEPALIAAARRCGVSWNALAPVLGVASRQAAERRYLRLAPAAGPGAGNGDSRVRAERDRRAGQRAVTRWANDNTADLRRLAGQITALDDLGEDATITLGRLHHALAASDASTLPALLADTQQHLGGHPELAGQVGTVTAHAEELRRRTQQDRDGGA